MSQALVARLRGAQAGWRARRALTSLGGASLVHQIRDVRSMVVELRGGEAPDPNSFDGQLKASVEAQVRSVRTLGSQCGDEH